MTEDQDSAGYLTESIASYTDTLLHTGLLLAGLSTTR